MRVVMIARTVVDLAARMAALDLNRRVADGKLSAKPTLEVPDEVLHVG